MIVANMGVSRTCVCLLVIYLNFQYIAAKPMFGSFDVFCDLFCEDDDDDDYTTFPTAASTFPTSSTTSLGFLDYLFCGDCTPSTPTRQRFPFNQPINVMIPPNTSGMNVTMINNDGTLGMIVQPWGRGPPFPMATTTPPATTAATTAAPATTAATTAGTTAKATTPAATTAAG